MKEYIMFTLLVLCLLTAIIAALFNFIINLWFAVVFWLIVIFLTVSLIRIQNREYNK